jgi:hypothetical protein
MNSTWKAGDGDDLMIGIRYIERTCEYAEAWVM